MFGDSRRHRNRKRAMLPVGAAAILTRKGKNPKDFTNAYREATRPK
jgi:hypothetical protein